MLFRWRWRDAIKPALLPQAPAPATAPVRPDEALPAQSPASSSGIPSPGLALADAATGQPCRVVAVHAPAGQAEWARWLEEIGFLPGERVQVHTRSAWGGDPMVVRVGDSSFALRRAEAACVRVEPA